MRQCKICGATELEKDISRRGLCPECSRKRLTDTITQLRDKSGPVYEKWKEAMKDFLRREEKWKKSSADMCK